MNATPVWTDLRDVIARAAPRLLAVSDHDASAPGAPGKWSRKELVGHLIDSASNNHQRFVRARFQRDLVFPGYEQDDWVGAQRYRERPWRELVELWRGFNVHLAHVMETTPEELRLRASAVHSFDRIAWKTVPAGEPATLDYFMRDYVGHLRHHLRQAGVE